MNSSNAMHFSTPRRESDIAVITGLSEDETTIALFQLSKMNLCEGYIEGKFIYGIQKYVVFSILAGMYLASEEGHKDIYSI